MGNNYAKRSYNTKTDTYDTNSNTAKIIKRIYNMNTEYTL